VLSLKIESKKANNNGISIHYLDSNAQSSLVPLLICPGLSETAEEYLDLMEYLLPRRCVVLSFRGRGQSDTPDVGYNLEGHISDIDCVVKSANLSRFHLYSYSRGVSYALGYLEKNISKIISVIVQDYPAQHKKMPLGWADEYINNYLVPFSRQRNIRPEAVRGIQRESEQVDFQFKMDKKILVLRGLLEGSLLDVGGISEYQRLSPEVIIKNFQYSGHDIRNTEKDFLYRTLSDFVSSS
jgi:pimeloyl-ACP methyl ester carboxylesterase